MKIAVGHKLQSGSFGGGNSLAVSFEKYFSEAGHKVVFDLDDDGIDIILITDPRQRSPNVSFSGGQVTRYLFFRNKNAIVVQLIQDCDERKNTKTMNLRQKLLNYCADYAVTVGSWMNSLDIVLLENKNRLQTILNGGRPDTFNYDKNEIWNGEGVIKLVTHHWGGNWMKGFDVYQKLDQFLEDDKNRKIFSFDYIGNLPKNFKFKNVKHIPPMNGLELAKSLRTYNAYLTASINEPAGLHHIEGAMCGLPIIYRDSGGLPEYCSGHGVEFQGCDDVMDAILKMKQEYNKHYVSLDSYTHTDKKMTSEYLLLFNRLLKEKESIVKKRNLFRNPIMLALNQLPL